MSNNKSLVLNCGYGYGYTVKEVIDNTICGVNYYLDRGITESMNKYNKKDENNGE